MAHSMHNRSVRRHKNKRRKFLGACTMTYQNLLTLYDSQQRRCAISGLPLTHIAGSHWQASADRINDTTDYDGNTRIVALELNTAAKWSAVKLRFLRDARTILLDQKDREQWLVSLQPIPPREWATAESVVTEDGMVWWRCTYCHKFKPADQMARNPECLTCNNDRNTRTIRSELKKLLSSARGSSEKRKSAAHKHNKAAFATIAQATELSIDVEFLCHLIVQQDFRCAYSGVLFQFPAFGAADECFRISLERIDPKHGYIPGNVCLIARGFQSTDITRVAKYPGTGSSGWSKMKVNYMIQWLNESDDGLTTPTQTYDEYCASHL